MFLQEQDLEEEDLVDAGNDGMVVPVSMVVGQQPHVLGSTSRSCEPSGGGESSNTRSAQ